MQGIWIIVLMGLAGALISFTFFPLIQKKEQINKPQRGNYKMNPDNNPGKNPKTISDRWAFRLALLGLAAGIFAGFSQGVMQPAILLGFALPFVCIFALIGGAIDFFKKS